MAKRTCTFKVSLCASLDLVFEIVSLFYFIVFSNKFFFLLLWSIFVFQLVGLIMRGEGATINCLNIADLFHQQGSKAQNRTFLYKIRFLAPVLRYGKRILFCRGLCE